MILVTEEVSLDDPSEVGMRDEEKSLSNDSDFNHSLVYTKRNNCVIDGRDEIIATQNCRDSDLSSINSSVVDPAKVRKAKGPSREVNAKKFFDKLTKAKKKVVKKKLNMQDYYARLRNDKGFVKVDHTNFNEPGISSEEGSDPFNDDSSILFQKLKNRKLKESSGAQGFDKSDMNNKLSSKYFFG